MPALPWSSDALAFTDTVPEALEPSKGLLIVTTGAETSATTLLATFTDTAADDLVFPAASTATTTRVAIPFARPDVPDSPHLSCGLPTRSLALLPSWAVTL